MSKLPFSPLDSIEDEPQDLELAAPEDPEEPATILFLTVGLRGSGKSTVAMELSQRFGIPIVTPEQLSLGVKGPCVDVEAPDFTGQIQWMARNAIGWYLARGVSVILDAGNLTRQCRAGYLEVAKQLGAKCIAMLVVCSNSVLKRRQRAKGVSLAEEQLLGCVFEVPEVSEGLTQVRVYMTDPPEEDPVEALKAMERRRAPKRSRSEYEAV